MKRFMADESGATAIEYALIATLIGMVLVTAMSSIGISLSDVFTELQTAI